MEEATKEGKKSSELTLHLFTSKEENMMGRTQGIQLRKVFDRMCV